MLLSLNLLSQLVVKVGELLILRVERLCLSDRIITLPPKTVDIFDETVSLCNQRLNLRLQSFFEAFQLVGKAADKVRLQLAHIDRTSDFRNQPRDVKL